MNDIKEFFSQLEEATDDLWKNYPPRIELRGWWWKKHIPHYRCMRAVMQQLINMKWEEEYPKIREMIEQMQREDFDHQMMNWRNPNL